MSRIRVVEKARYMSYALGELQRQAPLLSRPRRLFDRLVTPSMATTATLRLIHPKAYAAVGLDPRHARRVAHRNPHWRSTRTWAAGKVMQVFDELDLISRPGRLLLRRVGIVGAATP